MKNQKMFLLLFAITTVNLTSSYDYPRPIEGYYSQKGQDKFLNETIFKGKKGGFFVEVGAHDGISFSNTYFFEKNLGWNGICVDPNPNIFHILRANRNCVCVQMCISNSAVAKAFLLCSGYMLEMYSGLIENYDPRHLNRIHTELKEFGGDTRLISVDCCALQVLFETYAVTHIDFLSIDIEGSEKEALETIDFEKTVIDVIVVENNFDERYLRDYLKEKGYLFTIRLGKDDIYVRKGYSYDV